MSETSENSNDSSSTVASAPNNRGPYKPKDLFGVQLEVREAYLTWLK